MPQHVPPRIYRRVPFETAVRLSFDRFHGFVEQYSANLSLGGMFIRSHELPPLGADVTVEFHLEDGFELIRGRGRVMWRREVEDSDDEGGDPPGFGLRFLELTPGSRELIFRLVERRVREGGQIFDIDEAAPATARLVHDEERLAAPPWDLPAPRSGEEAAARGASGAGAHGAEAKLFGRATRESAAREAAGTPSAVAASPEASFAALAAADDEDDETLVSSAAVADAPENPRTAWAAVADASKNPHTPSATAADEAEEQDDASAAAVGASETARAAFASPADEAEERGDALAAAMGASPPARDSFASPAEEVERRPERTAGEAGVDSEASFAGLAEVEEEPEERFEWSEPAVDRGHAGGERPSWAAAGTEGVAAPTTDLQEGGDVAPAAAAWGAPAAATDAGTWQASVAAAPIGPLAAAPADDPAALPPPPRRRGGLLAGLAAALAVVALAAFLLFRVGAAPAPAVADDADATGRSAAATAATATTLPAAPVAPTAGAPSPTDASPATPLAEPSAAPATAPPAAATAGGARTIERIAFERHDGGLDFEIAGGGPIAPAQVDHFRVAGERPRLVVRIAGVERPYGRGEIAVGGGLVERVRTGFHPPAAGADAGSLHVVFDLASAGAAASVDAAGGRVRVRIEGG